MKQGPQTHGGRRRGARASLSRILLLCAAAGSLSAAQARAQDDADLSPSEAPAEADSVSDEADVADPVDIPAPEAVAEAQFDEELTDEEEEYVEEDQESGLASFLSERVAIHGYGTWGFGYTANKSEPFDWTNTSTVPDTIEVRNQPSNNYVFGDGNGNFNNVIFALREIVSPTPELMFAAGQDFYITEGRGFGAELDFAFAEYRPIEMLALRRGRMPGEPGLYTPVFDVGTLRPFPALAQSIYGPVGTIPKSYNGGSVTLIHELDSGWGLRATGYVGSATMPLDPALAEAFNIVGGYLPGNQQINADSATNYNLMVGAVLNVTTPLPGIIMQASGYVVPPDMDLNLGALNYVLTGSFGYVGEELEVRAEYAYRHTDEFADNQSVYVEAAYRFFDNFQVALRYEYMDFGLFSQNIIYEQILQQLDELSSHQALSAGVNYWFTRDFVVKLAYSYIMGNHFAHPDRAGINYSFDSSTLTFNLAPETHYLEFASSFTF